MSKSTESDWPYSIWIALHYYNDLPAINSLPLEHRAGAITSPNGTSFMGQGCMGGRALPPSKSLLNQQRHHHLCDLLNTGDIYCHISQASSMHSFVWGVVVKPPKGKLIGTIFVSVSCAESHICGLLSDGTHYCQDIGKFNELGSDTSATVLLNQPSSTSYGSFVSVSTHTNNACGVRHDGGITCWGANTANQLSIPPMNIFTHVQVGLTHICGYGMHAVVCWGVIIFQAGPAFQQSSCTSARTVLANPITGSDGVLCGGIIIGASACASLAGALASGVLTSFVEIALAGGEYQSGTSDTLVSYTGIIIRPMTIAEGGNNDEVVLNAQGHTYYFQRNLVVVKSIVFTNGAPAVRLGEHVTGIEFINCTWRNNIGTSAVGQAVRLQLRSAASFNNCRFYNNKGNSAIHSSFTSMFGSSLTMRWLGYFGDE
jgi:hypothetical protein